MRVNPADVLLFLFLALWLGTCSFNQYQERECMTKCQRPINECEKVCDR